MKIEELSLLLVEDEEYICYLLKKFFYKLGYKKIVCCYSGTQAIEIIQKKKFDIAIVDLFFPSGIQGETLLSKIKFYNQKCAVVIMSGKIDMDKKLLIEKGAIDVVKKPFNIEVFSEIFSYILKVKNNFDFIIKRLFKDCPCGKNDSNCVFKKLRYIDLEKQNIIFENLSYMDKEKMIYSHFRCCNNMN